MQEVWIQALTQEDTLEKKMATHYSILAWRIPWAIYSPWGREESNTLSNFHFLAVTHQDV